MSILVPWTDIVAFSVVCARVREIDVDNSFDIDRVFVILLGRDVVERRDSVLHLLLLRCQALLQGHQFGMVSTTLIAHQVYINE